MSTHKWKKLITFSFIIVITFFFSLPFVVQAQTKSLQEATGINEPLVFKAQIGIPNFIDRGETKTLDSNSTVYIAQMVKAFYDYGVGIAGILAAIMLMAGGLIWLTSAGNSSRIEQAKNLIFGSIIGLVLLFGAWMMLKTINPNLVDFKIQTITTITPIFIIDGEDGYIDAFGSLPPDTEIKVKCLHIGQTCTDTQPPSMNLDESICIDKKPQEWLQAGESCKYYNQQTRHCCAVSPTINKEMDKFCADQANGTPCRSTATDVEQIGICKNKKCEGGNVCCQCGQGCIGGVCATTQCKNDLNPKECREWCANDLLGWSVFYNIGGSQSYNCSEGLMSTCNAK